MNDLPTDLTIELDGYGSHLAITSRGERYRLVEYEGGIRISAENGLISVEPESANVVVVRPRTRPAPRRSW